MPSGASERTWRYLATASSESPSINSIAAGTTRSRTIPVTADAAAATLVKMALNVACMALATAAVLAAHTGGPSTPVFAFVATFVLTLVQLALCGAFAVLFSTFTTATLASIYTLSIVAAGWLFGEVRGFWLVAKQVEMKQLVRVLDVLLPNMSLLDLKESVTYGDPVALGSVVARAAYGLGYAATLVLLAAILFTRRDIR